ncbi:MAG: glycosyltransferase family 9 protein, partial [Opitutaceae bacterium]
MSASPSESIPNATKAATPGTILVLRPDAMGDLVLFSASVGAMRELWPTARIAVLIRDSHADLARLLVPSVEWITTSIDPFAQGPEEKATELESVLHHVRQLHPEWVLAACSRRTWLDFSIAQVCPRARRVALASGEEDRYFGKTGSLPGKENPEIRYEEIVPLATDTQEWKRGFLLAEYLAGKKIEIRPPIIAIPENLRAEADTALKHLGLARGTFVACAAAGFSNVRIKTWPPDRFARIAAWLDKEMNVPVLLLGQESERDYLERIKTAARTKRVKIWLGKADELPLLAALLSTARLYFG